MGCITNFTLPDKFEQSPAHEMSCQEAMEFMKKIREVPTHYEYLKKVQVTAENKFFSVVRHYHFLSFNQFDCVLNCAVKSQCSWQQMKCINVCHQMIEFIKLTDADLVRFKERSKYRQFIVF